MTNGYLEKCVDNWVHIALFVLDKYEEYPYLQTTTLINIPKRGFKDFGAFGITSECDVVLLIRHLRYLNGRIDGMHDGDKLFFKQNEEDFCYAIAYICEHWTEIVNTINEELKGFHAVMNFKI